MPAVDRNALARALIKNGMTENDLIVALDELSRLAATAVDLHADELDPSLREGFRSHVDRLKPVLNATFRAKGIHSDPFVPRFAGVRIEYRADERGFAASVYGEGGGMIMTPYVCDERLESVRRCPWDVEPPKPADGPLSREEIVAAATGFVARLATMWELPLREPYVGEASADSGMEEALASVQNYGAAPSP